MENRIRLLEFSWKQLNSFGIGWFRMNSIGLTCNRLVPLGITWTRIGLIGLTRIKARWCERIGSELPKWNQTYTLAFPRGLWA